MPLKEISIKTCKECRMKRFANTSYCFKHYREREKKKKEEKVQRVLLRKQSTKKFQENLRKKLHGIAWKLMSEWIRRKDANLDGFVECYTCGCWKHWKEMNAGHFKHDKRDFDERNVKCQCVTCNKYYSGRLDVYLMKLIEENGLEWVRKLIRDCWDKPGYTILELKQIILDLKEKIKTL
jgi:hypothetical protein